MRSIFLVLFAVLASVHNGAGFVLPSNSARSSSLLRMTVLEKMGGEPALEKAVDIFYDKVVVEPKLEKFFKDANMDSLRAHQYNFMKIAFTSAPADIGDIISKEHARLLKDGGLKESHFDVMASHLKATLEGMGLAKADIDEVSAIVGQFRQYFPK